jgi:hypothetical protein
MLAGLDANNALALTQVNLHPFLGFSKHSALGLKNVVSIAIEQLESKTDVLLLLVPNQDSSNVDAILFPDFRSIKLAFSLEVGLSILEDKVELAAILSHVNSLQLIVPVKFVLGGDFNVLSSVDGSVRLGKSVFKLI